MACTEVTCKRLDVSLIAVLFLLFVQNFDKSFSQDTVESVVTFHEATTRFWPAPDPNRFGVASNLHNGAAKSQERFTRNLSSSFKTKDGRSVAVFDDVLEYKTQTTLQDYIHLAGVWRFHGYNRSTHDRNSRGSSGIPWMSSFDTETFANSETGRRMLGLVTNLSQAWQRSDDDNKFEPYKVVCNILRRGDIIYPHRDAQNKETELTALLYLNQLWRKNDYGELLFLEESDVFATIGPKFNRVVVWDSSIDYLTRPPSMAFKQSQFFLMVHYTRNHTKAQQYKQARIQSTAERKQAEADLFATMNKPVSESLDIGSHVTMKYVAKNSKKVFVFDDLFSSEDLDKLRKFTANHGNYFFDDSIDSDSDNVQWIAGFNIDDFVQSRMWNITRQVARYVSGTDKWFPYDIACNIIRAYDHTRIHEDCEKKEDEWTFLLYLTPNWTENYYGETVFRENNRDDSEYVASVVPRYGRVAIFQGIIPHSARPPSTLYTGARLSFAVKLSVNPWVARVKMLKQEFAHEESMHQSVLSILKYYNDASFEARYKKQLISTAQDIMEIEQEQRLRYLKDLQELHLTGEDADREREEEDDEDDDDDDDGDREEEGGDFDFEESYQRDDENEFPEINLRKEYIYNLIKTLNPDAEALATHYAQFLKDREVMTQRYMQEIAQLF
ncbi:uncharacterized protein LOC119746140 [Patiria miniata]|uniref:Prolyl 4-hydroxylase alpha subunit Fe(2+) 2OG dioxygenase domain-containing protein n=1 Tax=Patiria miniata TaxID=46514 RepID=A0A914BTD1_PATMI|nr:uncharacterized protein LOC119746140 [Patiria miniata]